MDRLVGARGETAFAYSNTGPAPVLNGSGLSLIGPTLPRVNLPVDASGTFAWAPGRRALIVLQIDDGLVTTGTLVSVAGSTPTTLGGGFGVPGKVSGTIVGFTPRSALFAMEPGKTWRVALDGSTNAVVPGFVVGVTR